MKRNNLRRSPLQSPINSPEFGRTFVFDRAPTEADYRNFKLRDLWIHRSPGEDPEYGYHVLVDKPSNSGIWLNLSASQLDDIQTITGDEGTPVDPDVSGNVNIIGGTGITTSGAINTLTINAAASPHLIWEVNTTSPINTEVEKAYIANGVGVITYNLPALAVLGDEFAFYDIGGNGFLIKGQAGQTIRLGNKVTSLGGTVTSSNIGDVIWIVCAIENTTFLGYSAQGNLIIS